MAAAAAAPAAKRRAFRSLCSRCSSGRGQPVTSAMTFSSSVSSLAIIFFTGLPGVRMSITRSIMSGTRFRQGGKEISGSPEMSKG